MLYSNRDVLKFLPHRDPFLFIDTVKDITHEKLNKKPGEYEVKELVGTKIFAEYKTRPDHDIFKGHFPGRPILPGVVQVEMMAQASGFVLHFISEDITNLNLEVALLSVSFAKFRKPIYPDMDLEIISDCTRARSVMITNQCKILHKGELMSEAEVMASVRI